MSEINKRFDAASDSEDGDSIPSSSIPSYNNSPQNSQPGSRSLSPNCLRGVNPANVANSEEPTLNDTHAQSYLSNDGGLHDIEANSTVPALEDTHNDVGLRDIGVKRAETNSTAPGIVARNGLFNDDLIGPCPRIIFGDAAELKNDEFVDRSNVGSTIQLDNLSKNNFINEGFVRDDADIRITRSATTSNVNNNSDEDVEPGYCGKVKLGFFACRKRSKKDFEKSNKECAACCARLAVECKSICTARWWKEYLMDRFPCSKWIPNYRLKHLRGDISAGLTTGFSIIPQGLAYGQIVEVAAEHGLYSSVMGSYAYAVLGTSRHVAVGPSAILSIVSAEYATGRSPVYHDATYASILAFFTGFILIAMGLLRLGVLFTFISQPVWKAFRAAAGIVTFASRIKKWWGLLNVPRQFIPQLVETLRRMKETNLLDLFFGSIFIILLVLFKKLKAHKWKQRFRDMNWKWKIVKKFTWFLGAERNILIVSIGSAIVYALLQKGWNISHTSVIPRGIPFPAVPAFSLKVNENITVGLSEIAQDIGAGFFFTPLVAMYETLNVGNTYGRKTNYRVDYNQELIAIGVGNVLSSSLQGHPICGAYLRSGINFGAQVRTPAGGILAATVLIVLTYIAHHVFYYIPVCAMAATIMMGAIDVCTFHKFGFLWNINKVELLTWSTTFISSLVIGIEYGVLVGVLTDWLLYLIIIRSPKYKKTEVIENGKSWLVFSLENKAGFLAPSIHNISLEIEREIFYLGTDIERIYLNLQNIYKIDCTAINWLIYLQVRCKKSNKEFKIINAQDCVLRTIKESDARISLK